MSSQHSSEWKSSYIWVSNTLHFGFGNIIADRRNSEKSVFVSFLGDVPKSKLVCSSQVIVRANLVLVGFSSDALACVPLIASHSHPEYMVGRKLLLPKVSREAKLVFFAVNEVVKVRLNEYCGLNRMAVSLWMQNLFDLIRNRILFHFSEAVVSGIDWPVVGTLFLLSRIIILVRLKVLEAHLFRLRHIFS